MKIQHLSYEFKNTYNIGYEHINRGEEITALYIHGFGFNPWEKSADFIKQTCTTRKMNFFRFELIGHGSDSEHFLEADYHLWTEQILDIIDNKISGPILLVAHSLGSGVGLIAATLRPERFVGIITMALAVNAADIIAHEMQRNDWRTLYKQNQLKVKWDRAGFIFTKKFILSGLEKHLSAVQLNNIKCPVFLLHGSEDKVMPVSNSVQTATRLGTTQVVVTIVRNGHYFRDKNVLKIVKFAIAKMAHEIRKGAS